MRVGCVTEMQNNEFRVGMSPADVKQYTNAGHNVLIQSGAGVKSGFSDDDYIDQGAKIFDTAKEVWENSDFIVKVKEPLEPEYQFLREGLILFTYLHLAAHEELTLLLRDRKVTSFAYETVTDDANHLPLLTPMSQIAGRLSVFTGAQALEATRGGLGILLPGVPGVRPANVLILGAGVVGANAAAVANGIGANVTLMDVNLKRLSELDNQFGHQVSTLFSDEKTLDEQLPLADLVISTVLIPGAKAPKLVKKHHLTQMKRGAVIVDVAIDQGGSTEVSRPTTHDNPTYTVDGIVMYCVSNMPGAVPVTSTKSLTNATIRYGLAIAKDGVNSIRLDKGLQMGLNTYAGHVTNAGVASAWDLDYVDPLTLID